MAASRQPNNDNWRQELAEIVSGASGGFLFGTPLLYTMEVWSIGSYIQPPFMLVVLSVTLVIILLLNRIEGFRPQESATFPGAIAETTETLAIGLICATVMLIVLGRIDLQTPLVETLGKIIFEGVPFALGVTFSRSLLSGDAEESLDRNNSNESSANKKQEIVWQDTLADLSATLIGALFIAFSIAPTDEIIVIAASASPGRLLLIIAASLLISYCIVFASNIANYQHRLQQQGLFQTPQSETVISYLVSIFASMLMLWFFQQLTFSDPWFLWLRYSIILALPASIGGAAGRLAV